MADTRDQILRRILNEFPHWYAKEENRNLYNIMNAFAKELQAHSVEMDRLKIEIPVDTSTGSRLDALGRLFKISRRPAETDDELRVRIKAFFPGFSGGGTIPSIKAAISKSTGFSESIIDIIEDITQLGEKHFYTSTTNKYLLNYKNVQSVAEIRGTASAAPFTFTETTDFIIVGDHIEFGQGGTDPDVNTIFEVDYDTFDEMRFQIVIPISPTSTLFDVIRELIPGIKAAGTQPIIVWLLLGGPLDETVTVTDAVFIEPTSLDFFIVDVSEIDSDAVIS